MRPYDENEIDKFKVIEIETYHGCNRNCKTCPNSLIEKHGELMEEKVYFTIMDYLKKTGYNGRISPYDMNEPTLDKRLPDWIRRTREIFPKNVIYIGSNGIAIDQDYVKMLFANGLSQILITCYDEFVYEKFKSMEDNKKVRLWPVFRYDLEKIFMNRAGNVKVGPKVAVQRPCEKGLHQTMINYKGDMVFCCSDYYYEEVAGNVMDEPIAKLYNCKKYKKYRELLAKGDRASIPLCSRCNFLRTEEDVKRGK